MTDNFNFDQLINRESTGSLKYDARESLFGRVDITPMWVADMDFAVAPAITTALEARAQHPIYGYTDTADSLLESLVDWMYTHHNWTIDKEWIMLCPGVVPSLHATILALTKPNDGVIVQPPVYFPFFSSVNNTGRTVIENPLVQKNEQYTINFDHLEQCAKHASMLLLCSPHNPVGRVWQQTELTQLLDIAERYNLTVLSDEIHADLVYSEYQHYALAPLATKQSIITAIAPSKTFNIPGLGLSAMIVPDAAHRIAISKAFDTLHVSASNPFSLVAFEAAYRHGEPWRKALLDYLRENRDFACQFFKQDLPQIKVTAPEGTYLLWLNCRALNMSDKELKDFFIQQAGLGLSPGRLFGEAGSGFMRMNIGAPKVTIQSALNQVKNALHQST